VLTRPLVIVPKTMVYNYLFRSHIFWWKVLEITIKRFRKTDGFNNLSHHVIIFTPQHIFFLSCCFYKLIFPFRLEHIRGTNALEGRKTKIVCTLGPACWSEEGLGNLIDAGMNIARFNFSHGDHATHFACLQRLRAAVAKRPGVHVAVMLGNFETNDTDRTYHIFSNQIQKAQKFELGLLMCLSAANWSSSEATLLKLAQTIPSHAQKTTLRARTNLFQNLCLLGARCSLVGEGEH